MKATKLITNFLKRDHRLLFSSFPKGERGVRDFIKGHASLYYTLLVINVSLCQSFLFLSNPLHRK